MEGRTLLCHCEIPGTGVWYGPGRGGPAWIKRLQTLQGRIRDEAVEAGVGHTGQSCAGMMTFDIYPKGSRESLEGVRQRDNLMRFAS